MPPITRIEVTVLDLIDSASTPDEVVGLLSVAVGRKLTTADRLLAATFDRSRLKWRSVVGFALGDISDGVRSPLERHFYRDVERAHGLPTGDRQDPAVIANTAHIYRDVRYTKFGVVVELDGRAAHPAEQRARDMRRDNAAALDGDVVLHFGWNDVVLRPCQTAAQLTRALRNGGWQRLPRECSSACKILES